MQELLEDERFETVRSSDEQPLFSLFVVHSGITEIVADLTFDLLSLQPADAGALSFRGDFRMRHVRTETVQPLPSGSTWMERWRDGRRFVKQCDTTIDELIQGRRFRLFVPHLAAPTYRYLSTHRLCSDVSYTEEGTTSYFQPPGTGRIEPFRLRTLYRLVHDLVLYGPVRRHGILMLRLEDYYPDWEAASFYFLGACAFPFARNRFQLETENLPDEWAGPAHILAVDRLTGEAGEDADDEGLLNSTQPPDAVPLADYLDALERLLDMLIDEGVEALAYKFHPGENRPNAEAVRQALDRRPELQSEELPRSFNIERSCRGRQVYSLFSSSSHYAYLFGGTGYSFKQYLAPQVWRSMRSESGPSAPASLIFGREFPRLPQMDVGASDPASAPRVAVGHVEPEPAGGLAGPASDRVPPGPAER